MKNKDQIYRFCCRCVQTMLIENGKCCKCKGQFLVFGIKDNYLFHKNAKSYESIL